MIVETVIECDKQSIKRLALIYTVRQIPPNDNHDDPCNYGIYDFHSLASKQTNNDAG